MKIVDFVYSHFAKPNAKPLWYSDVCRDRTVGTAVARRTRRAAVVTGLDTAVHSVNTGTGRRTTSPANRTSPRLLGRRRPHRPRATASRPSTAGPRASPSRGPAAVGLRRPSRRRSTSARRRQRRRVAPAPARRPRRPSPSRRLASPQHQQHVQKSQAKLPPSYDCAATCRMKTKHGLFVLRTIRSA